MKPRVNVSMKNTVHGAIKDVEEMERAMKEEEEIVERSEVIEKRESKKEKKTQTERQSKKMSG